MVGVRGIREIRGSWKACANGSAKSQADSRNFRSRRQVLFRLLSDEAYHKEKAKAAPGMASLFTWQQTARRTAAAYDLVLERRQADR